MSTHARNSPSGPHPFPDYRQDRPARGTHQAARPRPGWAERWRSRPKFIPAAAPVPVYWACGILVLIATLLALHALGRPLVSPDGPVLFWDGEVGGEGNSQNFLDWYSLLHLSYGLGCAGVLWLTSRRWPLGWLLVVAMLAAAGWEIPENTPFVIARFGSTGADPSYSGDTLLNATGDMLCVVGGCLLGFRIGLWRSIALAVGIEVLLAVTIHDSLAIGAIMLLHPLEAIEAWRSAA